MRPWHEYPKLSDTAETALASSNQYCVALLNSKQLLASNIIQEKVTLLTYYAIYLTKSNSTIWR